MENKKRTIVKIREEQIAGMNEIIDADGSIIKGDRKESDTEIRTNYYKTSGRPQTSDDFADETGQDSKWFYYHKGYGYSVAESQLKEVEVKEDIIPSRENNDLIGNNMKTIPDVSELTKGYKKPDLAAALKNVLRLTKSFSTDEVEGQDIEAIVLKAVLAQINFKGLRPEHQKEIKKMMNGQ